MKIYEDDGETGDDEVELWTAYNTDSSYQAQIFENISSYCDGDNGTAEFYVIRTNDPYAKDNVVFYD